MNTSEEMCVKYFNSLILDELKSAGIKCWVAGGAVRDFLMGKEKEDKDIDIFFENETEYSKAVEYFETLDYCETEWESEKSICFSYKHSLFNLVKIYFADPYETINSFDISVSMFAVDTEKIYYYEWSLKDLSNRVMQINDIDISPPVSTLRRVIKYANKGFNITNSDLFTLYTAIRCSKDNSDFIQDYYSNPSDINVSDFMNQFIF